MSVEIKDLAKECFAYQAMRKYPFHTKEAALKSLNDFEADKDSYGPELRVEIEGSLTKAASFYGIKSRPIEKRASTARRLRFEGGVTMSEIKTGEDLDKAADAIISKRASARLSDLRDAAKYVMWCAANSDSDTHSERFRKIARIAGAGINDREVIVHEFMKRATVIPFGGTEHEIFWKFAKDLEALPDEDFYNPENLVKVADAMEAMDERYSGERGEDKALGYPEDTVFGQDVDDLTEEAEDLITIPSIDTTISRKALEERANAVCEFFNTYLGKNLTADSLDMDQIIDTIKGFDRDTATNFLEAIG